MQAAPGASKAAAQASGTPRRSSSNVGIVFRRGQYQVAMGDLMPKDSVAWMKPKLVELAKLAAAKLR